MHGTDYQKVSDSVPHRWIIKSLELIGINCKTVSLSKKDIRHWKTSMRLRTDNRNRGFRKTMEYCKEIHCNYYSFALALSPHTAVLQAEYRI